MKKLIIGGAVLIIVIVVVVIVMVLGGGGDTKNSIGNAATKPSGDVVAPIQLQDAKNVGSLSIRLSYDSSVLQLNNVVTGEIAKNAMLEFNAGVPGRVVIGIVDANGINGGGVVAQIGFTAVNTSGASSLKLEEVETSDATTLIDIPSHLSDGNYSAKDKTLAAPVIQYSQ